MASMNSSNIASLDYDFNLNLNKAKIIINNLKYVQGMYLYYEKGFNNFYCIYIYEKCYTYRSR